MAAPLSLSIVQPQSEHLKRISSLLHFIAGVAFCSMALYEYRSGNYIAAFSELVIGADVLVIAFIKGFAQESVKLNAWFRLIETIFFAGIGLLLILNTLYIPAAVSLTAAVIYGYVFSCERQLINKDKVQVHHLGVTISSFPNDRHIDWMDIRAIEAHPHSITITSRKNKNYHFQFQKGIALSELEQIHEFCSYYLK